MQDLYFTLTLFDAQAWFVRDFIIGRIPVGDTAHRAADIAAWQDREDAMQDDLVRAAVPYRALR